MLDGGVRVYWSLQEINVVRIHHLLVLIVVVGVGATFSALCLFQRHLSALGVSVV